MSIIGEIEGATDKAEGWVEKETGLIEHRVTSSIAYHSAEHIAKSIDKWFEGATASLDAETAKYYSEAAAAIKGIFQ